MVYIFTEDHKKTLLQLCDVALKAGGLGCLPGANEVLRVLNTPVNADQTTEGLIESAQEAKQG